MGVTSQFVRSAGPLAPMVASSFLADYRAAAAERKAQARWLTKHFLALGPKP